MNKPGSNIPGGEGFQLWEAVLNVPDYLELPQILCFFLMKKIDVSVCFGPVFLDGSTHLIRENEAAAFSNRPSGEPEDAGTIIDESIPKATEWTLHRNYCNYCDILGAIWGSNIVAAFSYVPLDLVRRY